MEDSVYLFISERKEKEEVVALEEGEKTEGLPALHCMAGKGERRSAAYEATFLANLRKERKGVRLDPLISKGKGERRTRLMRPSTHPSERRERKGRRRPGRDPEEA